MKTPTDTILVFVSREKHKVQKVHKMFDQHIHTTLTIQSKEDLMDRLLVVPELKFLLMVTTDRSTVCEPARPNRF